MAPPSKGAWEVTHSFHGDYRVSDVNTWVVLASMHLPDYYPQKPEEERNREMVDNAYLMAAAPDMLYALKYAVENIVEDSKTGLDGGLYFQGDVDVLHQALNKAGGYDG